ncbi:MAG: RES family NAD+ phosphorylase [Pseudomonadota bacterium]
MSSPIWTADALRSELGPWTGTAWRMVEAQHLVSTLKLVDTLEEQAVLEEVLERTKPALPPECAHLDYLLATPFRYGPYPAGSRFRRAGLTPGVLYGAEHGATAAAEMAHYRMQFFREAPGVEGPKGAAQFTAFSFGVWTPLALDLTAAPLSRDRAAWTDPENYAPCQDLAEQTRAAGGEVIFSQSVRDPAGRRNINVLTCGAIDPPAPLERQSWQIQASAARAFAICEHPRQRLAFGG